MSIKAHRRKKASFKAFSFATYKGWSVSFAKGAAVRLRPSRWNKMGKTVLGLLFLILSLFNFSSLGHYSLMGEFRGQDLCRPPHPPDPRPGSTTA